MAYNPLFDSIGFMLGQTYRKVSHLTNLRFKSHGITAEQWILLLCLLEHDGITQTALSEKSGKDKTTVTRLLDILHRKEMIAKRESTEDRRAYFIDLTDKGRKIAAVLIKVEQEVMEAVLEGFTEEQRAKLKFGLQQIQRNVDRELD